MRSRLLVICSLALLAGCKGDGAGTSKTDGSSNDATGGTLIINSAADPQNLFPPYVSEQYGRWIQDQIFDRLAEIDQDLNTVGDKGFSPRLAQRWTWSSDSLSIAFSIDPRARWHDGKPVTAADVRYSFRTFMDPAVGSPVAPLMTNVDSVSVRDSLTAVAWFKKRTPQQFYDLAYQLIIMPEHVYGTIPTKELRTAEATRHPVGSGRFRLVRWEPAVRLELMSDTANFRGRAKLDRVIFVPAAAQAAATQVLTGQSDFLEAYPIDQTKTLDSSKIARGFVRPQFGYAFMAMNPRDSRNAKAPHPIFSDIRVRRALSIAMDREGMLRNVFGSAGRISHGPFTMNLPFADSTLKLPRYDTATAKAMLDSSGWKAGPNGMRARNGQPLAFTLLTPTTSLFRKRYSVLIQEQLRKIGAAVSIENVDSQGMNDRQLAGSFDAVLASFNADFVPAASRQNWGTEGIGAQGQNFLKYSNPTVDARLDSAAVSFDPAKVRGYMSRAFQQIIDDVPAVWLYDITVVYAVNRRLTLAPLRPDEWWANLADWSIPPDKRIDRDRIGLAQPKP